MVYYLYGIFFMFLGVVFLFQVPLGGVIVFCIGMFCWSRGKKQRELRRKGVEDPADQWLREHNESLDRELKLYRANKKKKEELLDQANRLENEARYGSAYHQKELKKQAAQLRREAGRL